MIGKAMNFMGQTDRFRLLRVPESIKESISELAFIVLTSVALTSLSTVRKQDIYDQISLLGCQDVRTPGTGQRLPCRGVLGGPAHRGAPRNWLYSRGETPVWSACWVVPTPLFSTSGLSNRAGRALCYGFPPTAKANGTTSESGRRGPLPGE